MLDALLRQAIVCIRKFRYPLDGVDPVNEGYNLPIVSKETKKIKKIIPISRERPFAW
jgi:hypothetical protein